MPPKAANKRAASKAKSKEKQEKKLMEEKMKACEEKCLEARNFLEPTGKNPEPNFVKAKVALDAAEELFTMNPTLFFLRGQWSRMQGDYKEAVEQFSHALDLDPTSALTLEARAGCYEKLDDIPLAMEDYTSMIQIDPENDHAYNMRGMCVARGRVPGLHLRSAEFKRCVDDLKTAIRLNSANYYARANLGKVYEDQEMFEDAIACYTDSLRINVDYTYAKFRRGCCYLYLSEKLLLEDGSVSDSDDKEEEAEGSPEQKKRISAKTTYDDVEKELKARVALEAAKHKGHDFLHLAITDFEALMQQNEERC
ncbi:tetratricopeptide repeat (TPR) protein [Strigomonas culicis]|uniref:Tetratricopeptide repeat (TPR) protein n=1 Tax=Strigomonas culicis TaxID=28005 RepID=S9UKA3_9TRYP|nr:tetratricopeptide repeat (TPR) protein [Strigomonas culicis]|eukprot:EPY29358.1 tetratricopeptide repeat (TPR) protein [Strigomonas culicis]